MDELASFLKKHPNVKVKAELKAPVRQYLKPEYPQGYVPLEDEEQADLVNWLDIEHPEIKYFAVPNGSYKSPKAANKFKATGLKAGVPDIVYPEPRGWYHGYYQELKRIKGSDLHNLDQLLWHELLRGKGYCVDVVKGAEEAKLALMAYLNLGSYRWGR